MKIALLGAPGSGKTKFAAKLATAYANDVPTSFRVLDARKNNKPGMKPKVIDKYVDKLVETTGFEYGIHATYPQNFQILFQRWTLEQVAANQGYDTITCGSIYETILYTAIRFNSESMVQVNSSKDNLESELMGRAAMQALGTFEQTTTGYDLLFFLPYDGKTLLEKGKSYDTVVDKKLPEVVAGYFRNLHPLEGTEKEKVKRARDIIQAFTTWQEETAEDDGQAV